MHDVATSIKATPPHDPHLQPHHNCIAIHTMPQGGLERAQVCADGIVSHRALHLRMPKATDSAPKGVYLHHCTGRCRSCHTSRASQATPSPAFDRLPAGSSG
jgi:hypothetical protein